MTFLKVKATLATAVLLFSLALYACGSETQEPTKSEPARPEPAPTARPAPTLAPAPTVQRMIPNTPSPAEVAPPVRTTPPAISPTQMPATVVPEPTPHPTSTPEPPQTIQDSTTGAGDIMVELPTECLADGSLDEPTLILGCSVEAMSQLESVIVEATIDLGAMFAGAAPSGAPPIPPIEMEIARIFPNDVDAVLKIPEGGEVNMIVTGGAGYINDPMSNGWIKVPGIPEEMSQVLLTVGTFEQQVLEATRGGVEWGEVLFSDDGTKYVVSYKPTAADLGGMFGPAAPGFRVTLDAMNFLNDSIALVTVDAEGVEQKIVDIQYSRHNDPLTIEPPAEYTEMPGMAIPGGMPAPGAGDATEVVGLSKNDDGDVELRFSGPVTAVGDISLYVIDPATGGWELPMLSGSGTDTLTFDSKPEGNPSLIPGESVIPGLIFVSAESEILDSGGNPVNPVFDEWVYPN